MVFVDHGECNVFCLQLVHVTFQHVVPLVENLRNDVWFLHTHERRVEFNDGAECVSNVTSNLRQRETRNHLVHIVNVDLHRIVNGWIEEVENLDLAFHFHHIERIFVYNTFDVKRNQDLHFHVWMC
ncbi:hypothetical protein D3C81_1501070 [compost metagenome]